MGDDEWRRWVITFWVLIGVSLVLIAFSLWVAFQ